MAGKNRQFDTMTIRVEHPSSEFMGAIKKWGTGLVAADFGPEMGRIIFAKNELKAMVIGIYWKDAGRIYQVTKLEADRGAITCPSCKSNMRKAAYKKGGKCYTCGCGFTIKHDDLSWPARKR